MSVRERGPSERGFLIGLRQILRPIDFKIYKSYNHEMLSVFCREMCQCFFASNPYMETPGIIFPTFVKRVDG